MIEITYFSLIVQSLIIGHQVNVLTKLAKISEVVSYILSSYLYLK